MEIELEAIKNNPAFSQKFDKNLKEDFESCSKLIFDPDSEKDIIDQIFTKYGPGSSNRRKLMKINLRSLV